MTLDRTMPRTEGESVIRPIAHGRLADEAARILRQAIIAGQFKPGQHLPEADLARELGISRTPLREAFRMLEKEGVVTVSPSRGVQVMQPDYHSMCDLYDMREVMDGLASRRAATLITPEQMSELGELIAGMSESLATGAYAQWLVANIQFHQTVALASGNKWLIDLQPTIQASVQMFHPLLVQHQTRAQEALAEHRQIFQALLARDPGRAEEAARQHIRRAKQVLVDAMAGQASG